MGPGDHQLLGPETAPDHPERVGNRLVGAFPPLGPYGDPESHASSPPYVVAKRQPALPVLWHGRSLEAFQNLVSIGVAHRNHRNGGDGHRVHRQASRSFERRPARCGGVAAAVVETASLDRLLGAHEPARVHVPLEEAVILGIGIQYQTGGAPRLRLPSLDASEAAPVTCDHDRSIDRDGQGIEYGVVGRQAIVHEHDRTGDIPHPAVSVHRRPHALVGRRILRQRRLGEIQPEPVGGDQLHQRRVLEREENPVFRSHRVQTELCHLLQDVVRRPHLGRRTGDMRGGGEFTNVSPG